MNQEIKDALLIQKNNKVLKDAAAKLKTNIHEMWSCLVAVSDVEGPAIATDSAEYKLYQNLPLRMKMDLMSHFSSWLEQYAGDIIGEIVIGDDVNAVHTNYRCNAVREGATVRLALVEHYSSYTTFETFTFDELIGMIAYNFDYHAENRLFFTAN